MKLSAEVELGVKQLLEPLSWHELQQLGQTVTHQLLMPENRTEAVDMIVRFSESPAQLLKRQKVSRQLLMQYVDGARLTVSAHTLTKSELVAVVLAAWQCEDSVAHRQGQEHPHRQQQEDDEEEEEECSRSSEQSQEPRAMSLAFCRLFFDQLNCGRIDAALFWNNTHVRLTLCDGATIRRRDQVHTPGDSVALLNALSLQHSLHLLANTGVEGLQSARDKYGRHALAVCGTAVHTNSRAGLFQLGALLAPGPADQCWRLALLDLTVIAQPSVDSFRQGALPSLTECGLSVSDVQLQAIEHRADEVT